MRIQQFITKVRMLLSFKAFTAVIFFLVAAVLFGLLFSNVKPVTYDIELFSIAEKTIRAPKTVIDMKKTEEERIKAAEEVERAYVYKQEVAQNRVSLISSLFDFVKEVNSGKNVNKTDKEKLTLLKKKLTGNADEKITESISDQVLFTLLELNSEELEEMKTQVVEQVGFTLQKRIREENLKDAKEEVKNAIIGSSLPEPLKDAASKIASFAIVPTETFDEALTNERQKVAMEQVEPVRILQGQVIVQEGYLIDRETYRQLELLGLMERTVSAQPAVGLAVFVLVVIALLYYYFYTLPLSEEKKQLYLILVSLVFIFSLILMKIIDLISDEEFSEIVYIFPSAMAGMLISVMLNERLAMIITFLLAACGGIIFNDGMSGTINSEMSMYILFSGFAGILFLSSQRRFNILQAGLVVSFINVLVILFLKLLGSGQYSEMEHFYYAMFAIASGLISAVLTIGLLPFFEAGFGILSTMKLIELSNPNHPLLKKILTETPGTYH
ncbi:MAG TPA: hypothetical protein VEY51_16370, partial [Chondromyces sp.]|nr:hypothetical protein [Chondromyces sp.]